MLNKLSSAREGVAAGLGLGLLALSALYAVSNPSLPPHEASETCTANSPTATCGGRTWEKLICDDPLKLTKCFDAKTTCANWDVCDCCSPVPLHKCLSPLAGRAFGADCSSPIDAREECCGDAVTHLRAFQGLADLQDDVKEAVDAAKAAADEAQAKVTELASSDVAAEVKEKAEKAAAELKAKADELAAYAKKKASDAEEYFSD